MNHTEEEEQQKNLKIIKDKADVASEYKTSVNVKYKKAFGNFFPTISYVFGKQMSKPSRFTQNRKERKRWCQQRRLERKLKAGEMKNGKLLC